MSTTWTEDQLREEWRYIKEERLGLLCGDREPTQKELDIAIVEANAHIAALRRISLVCPSPPSRAH